MKLTVIGGGGVRSMFLAKSIAQKAAELHITELVFMDNDGEKLRIYGGLAAHVSRMLNPELKFRLTTDAVDAVKDADYIITTIRVGGDHMRVREERIALANGVLGQETTGAAVSPLPMRSVPGIGRVLRTDSSICQANREGFQLYQSRRRCLSDSARYGL